MPFNTPYAALQSALAARSYTEPTPVQAAVVDPSVDGRDLLVSAQTGSGKTVAYGLAVAATLLADAERFAPAGAPLALVIAPTRELALQVQRELAWLYAETGARIVSCVGGMDPVRERKALEAGCHVVVGTPGRLRDHLERGKLRIEALRAVVLDEADEMLNLGFREDLQVILDATPANRRTLLFSATIPAEIARLARDYQRDAARVDVVDRKVAHADIDYRAVRIAPHETERAVVNVLRWFDARAAIVFCSTREAVRRLHTSLVVRGFEAVALSGEMGQGERNEALQALRDGRTRVCVATDVAARGIDLADLSLVVHADLPNDRDTLLHRSGRTGRAGRKGTSVLLVPHSRRRKAEGLLAHAGLTAVWSGAPTADEIRRLDEERLVADPAFAEPVSDDERALAEKLIAAHGAEAVAAALVRLTQSRLPAPQEIADAARRPERQPYVGDLPPRDDAPGWFRLAIGRKDDADVRWILPLIAKVARIPKKEIGTIRIEETETLFKVSAEAAGQVAYVVAHPGDEEIRIEFAADAPPVRPERRKFAHGAPRARKTGRPDGAVKHRKGAKSRG